MEKHTLIASNFVTKCAQIITEARMPDVHEPQAINRWFNLETGATTGDIGGWELPPPGEAMRPLILECLLDASQLKPGQTLTIGGRRVDSTCVVLERYVIEACELPPTTRATLEQTPTHSVYMQAVVSMRALYTALRLLPAYSLRERLARQKLVAVPLRLSLVAGSGLGRGTTTGGTNGSTGSTGGIGTAGDGSDIKTFSLTPVSTLLGVLKLSVAYTSNVSFGVEDSEQPFARRAAELDVAPAGTGAQPILSKPSLNFTRPFKSVASSANSASSARFASSFARRTSQGDVAEFLQFLNDVRKPFNTQPKTVDVDLQLQRFQQRRNALPEAANSGGALEDDMLFLMND